MHLAEADEIRLRDRMISCQRCGDVADGLKWVVSVPRLMVYCQRCLGWQDAYEFQIRKPALSNDRYPHRCPTCKRRCYIGFLQIEHPPGVSCQ